MAATLTAASPGASDVQAAINSANPGDTVLVPAGNAVWTSTVSLGNGISLIGAGIGNTIVNANLSSRLINLSVGSGEVVRMEGIEFRDAGSGTYWSGRIGLSGASDGYIVVGNCKFVNLPQWDVWVSNVRGVIYGCEFVMDNYNAAIHVSHPSWQGIGSYGDNSWAQPVNDGTDEFFYVEDCVFRGSTSDSGNPAIDSVEGSRWVFRHNICTDVLLRIHGTDSGGRRRSTRAVEIYNNVVNHTVTPNWSEVLEVRGGVGIMFNNECYNFNSMASLKVFRESQGYNPWGQVTGSNPWDGNQDSTGYPALDQPGRGRGNLLSGSSPSPVGWPNQVSEPWYAWGNTMNGVAKGIGPGSAYDTMVSGRDFLNGTPKPGYTPYTYPHPLRSGGPVPPGNRAPVALNQSVSVAENAQQHAIALAGTDPDGDALTYSVVTQPQNGALEGLAPNVLYTPTTGYTGPDSFTFKVNDGEFDSGVATVSITVNSDTGQVPDTNVFYVDQDHPSAVDSASAGSETQPWRTLGFALAQIAGGDTIVVKESATPYDIGTGLYVYGPSGTAQAPTTLRAYPGHAPALRGAGNTGRFALDGVSHWVIEGLDIANLNHILALRNGANNITVRGCTLHDSGSQLVHVFNNAHDILLENNILYNGGSLGSANGEAFYIGTHNGGDFTHHVTVRGNTISNMIHEAIEFKHDTHDCIAENNFITDCVKNYDFGKWSILAFPTVSYASNPNHVIRGNVVRNHGPYGTGAAIGVETGCQVYNNVIYDVVSPAYAVEIRGGDSHTRYVWHNTMNIPSSRAINQSGGTASVGNNIGPGTAGNLAFNSAYFVNAANDDYHLVPGSAPVDAGGNVPFPVTQDFDGAARVAPYDLGAFEMGSSGGTPVLAVSPGSLDFGDVQVGSAYELAVNVQNAGSGTLTGTATVAPPFSIVSGGSYTLGSSQSQAVTIRFSPQSAGVQSRSVTFTGGGGASVPVTGRAWEVLSGLSWDSIEGLITSPFVASGGFIAQTSQTLDPAAGGEAVYPFEILTAGDYQIVASVNAPDNGANSFFLNIDSQPVSPTMIWDIPPHAGWTNQVVSWRGSGTDLDNEFSPKVFTLSAGIHQLIIRGREANTQLGRITVRPAVQAPAPPTGLRLLAAQ